ncbi:MAG: AMP-binding protein [Candidatus Bipolaricaulis sp.]|nr:AMP-binding protein [Candidatus Bipolaricaulis sp.]
MRSMYPTVSKLFEDAVETHKDRIALCMPIPKERKSGRGVKLVLNEISYGRLGEMVGRLARALSELGVGAGDRVAMISKPRAAWATSFFAILHAGATVVPLDPELQKGEIERILLEAGVKGILCSGSKVDDVAELQRGALKGTFVISMDRPKHDEVLFLDALLLGKAPLPRVEVDSSNLAILMYTSGTTGNAKGAMLTHSNISANALAALKVVDLGPTDRFLSIVPWNHIYGLTITLVTALFAGATTTYTPVDRNLAEVMKKARPTIILGVPKLYNVLYGRVRESIEKSVLKRMIDRSSPTLMGTLVRNKLFGKQFRFFTSGGAPLNPTAAAGFRRMGLGLMEGYGLTETSPLLSMAEAFPPEPGMTAIEDVDLRIDHPDENGVGEILARGPNIMQGYYKNPQATAEVLEPNGWFHTGDLGTYEHGRLLICGRAKNVIVLETGKNVYPEEIEWEFAGIPAIEEVMVHEGERQGAPAVCAKIYPNWTYLKAHGISDPDAAIEHLWEAIREKSENLAMFKRIKYRECISLVDEPFQKSAKLDIKRHLHQ